MTWIVLKSKNSDAKAAIELDEDETFRIDDGPSPWLVIPQHGYQFNLNVYKYEIIENEEVPLSCYTGDLT